MYRNKRIAVVIPAYNEAQFISEVIETVPEYVDVTYPVDDGSTDRTYQEMVRAATRLNSSGTAPEGDEPVQVPDGGQTPRVRPVRLDENRGVGGAIKEGYRRAMADGADVIAVLNGDGQMDPDELDRLLDPVVDGETAYAKGNRLKSSAHWTGMSRWRLFGNFLLTYLTRIASGYWRMTDPQNGYTAISARALEQIDLDDVYDRYGFLNSLLIRLNANDMRIADVEMPAIYGDESSSITYRQFVPTLSWLLLTGFLWRLRVKHANGHRHATVPYFLGIFGGVLSAAGLCVHLAVRDLYSQVLVLFLLGCVLSSIGVGMLVERKQNSVLQLTVDG